MNSFKISLILLSSIFLSGITFSCFANQTHNLFGKAYDAKTQAFLYAEDHVFNRDPSNASMKSRYRDSNGEVIAEKIVRFEQGRVTEIEFEQNKIGVARKLVRDLSSISYSSTKDNKTINKKLALNPNKEVILDAGLFAVVDRNWQTLLDGKKVKFDLAMPANKRTISMEVSRSNMVDSAASKIIESDNMVLLSLNIKNRLLRWLAPTIELAYYEDTKQLAFYKGPSNLTEEDGKTMRPIYVVYERSEKNLSKINN